MTLPSVAAPDSEGSSTSSWNSLPPELIRNVARFLSPNEVACSLRPLCHSTVSALSGAQYTTVRLSQLVQYAAYELRWGAPSAMRTLPRNRRDALVRLTAASGSIRNLELAVIRTGCTLTQEVVEAAAGAGQLSVLRWLQGRMGCDVKKPATMVSAAAGGHIAVCEWLRDKRCAFGGALVEAARAGRQDVCAWLLTHGCPFGDHLAVLAAAAAGHVPLMDWLLLQLPGGRPEWGLMVSRAGGNALRSVARGCPLLVLQQLHREWVEGPGGWLAQLQERGEEVRHRKMGVATAAAAASITPDWAAKVTWLQEVKGYPLTAAACIEVVKCCPTDEEALARLTWLQARGCKGNNDVISSAAGRGFTESLRYLLAEGGVSENTFARLGTLAAEAGHLACLQALHADGVKMLPAPALLRATSSGHLPVVRWLVETPGLEAVPLTVEVAGAAARSGSLEVLQYLHGLGCPWDARTWTNAEWYGSEEMLDWLREQGCPTQY